jgi:hypothetical protein
MPDKNAKAILNDIGTEELRSSWNGWKYSSSINWRSFSRRT